MLRFPKSIQSPKKVVVRGLVNFVPDVTYLFCLNLPAAFSQPGNGLLEILCNTAQVYARSLLPIARPEKCFEVKHFVRSGCGALFYDVHFAEETE